MTCIMVMVSCGDLISTVKVLVLCGASVVAENV